MFFLVMISLILSGKAMNARCKELRQQRMTATMVDERIRENEKASKPRVGKPKYLSVIHYHFLYEGKQTGVDWEKQQGTANNSAANV